MAPPPSTTNRRQFLPARRDGNRVKQGRPASEHAQFAPTPKFILPTPTTQAGGDGCPTPASVISTSSKEALFKIRHVSLRKEDSIDDSTPPDMEDAAGDESDAEYAGADDDEDMLLNTNASPQDARLTKRRKMSESELSSIQDRTSALSGHLNLANRDAWAFPKHPPRAVSDGNSRVNHKDSFVTVLPSANQSSVDPLPAAFSPRRKSQNFLPGGLAASMVGHIMDLASQSHSEKAKSQDFKALTIQSSRSPEMSTIRALSSDDQELNIILAGSGQRPQPNDFFTIHGIQWPVQILEEQHLVCVEWRVNRRA